MPADTTDLFLLEDLAQARKTSGLAQDDRRALQAVADWIKSFVIQPHRDLGRSGTVCPFVPGSLQRKTLWLAPEQITDREVSEVVELMSGYKERLLETGAADGNDDVIHNVIVVVFTDLAADDAQDVFDGVLGQLAVPTYEEHGILFGPFHELFEGTAIYNSNFRPFRSPVPFMFVRHGVVSDWKFLLDNEAMFNLWRRRFGDDSAVHSLAEELRRFHGHAAPGCPEGAVVS